MDWCWLPAWMQFNCTRIEGSLCVFKVKYEDNHIAQVKEDHKPQRPPVPQASSLLLCFEFLFIISKKDFSRVFIFCYVIHRCCFGTKFKPFTPNKRQGNKTPPPSLMSMERLCLIFCSICVSAVLVSNGKKVGFILYILPTFLMTHEYACINIELSDSCGKTQTEKKLSAGILS